jgi:hypothetical protein
MTHEEVVQQLDALAEKAWPTASQSWRKRLMLLMLQCLHFADSHSVELAAKALDAALRVLAGQPTPAERKLALLEARIKQTFFHDSRALTALLKTEDPPS